ncbi:TonB-dependent receptor [candidate division KSB1 bacterium]|nr:TonB-dependent receptor [candidate division KSB1 bacterium]
MVRKNLFRPSLLLSLFCVFEFFLSTSVGQAQVPPSRQYQVSGKIIDAQTGKPLAGANISISESAIGTTSDTSGAFALRVPPGDRILSVQYVGYQPARINLHAPTADTFLIINLLPEPIKLAEVNVEAAVDTPATGSFRVRGQELKDIPNLAADAYAAVKTLPAVASNNEMTGAFNVQGGSPEENLILLEGVEINQPQRIRAGNQESISPINPMLVQDLTLTAGGFPARYGERLSSVLVARYRHRSARKLSGAAELSLLNAGAMLEGQPNERLHWAVALRATDRRLLVQTLQTEGEFQPRGYDAQAILHYQISSRHRLQLLGLSGENLFRSEPKSQSLVFGIYPDVSYLNTHLQGHENFTHRFSLLALQLTHQLAPKVSLSQTLAWRKNFEHEDVAKTGTTLLNTATISSSQIRRSDQLRDHAELYQNLLQWSVSPALDVEAGMRYEQRRYDDTLDEMEQVSPASLDPLPTNTGNRFEHAGQSALFIRQLAAFNSYNLRLSKRLQLEAGWRWSYYENSAESILQPRLRLTFQKNARTTISASWGRYAQPAGYHERRAEGSLLRKEVAAQRATHCVAGVQHHSDAGNEWQVQLYYKKIDPFIPYRIEDIFIRFQPGLEARAWVYGASWYWRGQMTPRLTSWITYSYMNGRQTIQGEGRSRLPTDQRHTFALVMQDAMPEWPRSRAHIRLLFGSGYPFTAAYLKTDSAGRTLVTAPRNSLKLGLYRRIDIGMSYNLNLSSQVEARMTLEIFNVMNYTNHLAYAAFPDASGAVHYAPVNLSRRLFNGRVSLQF